VGWWGGRGVREETLALSHAAAARTLNPGSLLDQRPVRPPSSPAHLAQAKASGKLVRGRAGGLGTCKVVARGCSERGAIGSAAWARFLFLSLSLSSLLPASRPPRRPSPPRSGPPPPPGGIGASCESVRARTSLWRRACALSRQNGGMVQSVSPRARMRQPGPLLNTQSNGAGRAQPRHVGLGCCPGEFARRIDPPLVDCTNNPAGRAARPR